MGIAPGSVHEQAALVVTNRLGKGLGALLHKNVSPALLAGCADIDLGAIGSNKLRQNDLTLELGLANLSLDGAAVDGDITQVRKKLLSTVLAADQVEELRSVVDERRPASSVDEDGVCQEGGKERDIGLDATNAEFDQSSQDLPPSNFVRRAMEVTLVKSES